MKRKFSGITPTTVYGSPFARITFPMSAGSPPYRFFQAAFDPLGDLPVPADALWGIQTERARQNFPISNLRPLPAFVDACIWIKKAAALTHRETGRLDPKLADAISRAADEVLAGGYRDQFVVDPYQAGAGTSHNMNCNEVLANRANELLGGKRGEYKPVHPNDHVNMAQSTNDVIPTAIRLGALAFPPVALRQPTSEGQSPATRQVPSAERSAQTGPSPRRCLAPSRCPTAAAAEPRLQSRPSQCPSGPKNCRCTSVTPPPTHTRLAPAGAGRDIHPIPARRPCGQHAGVSKHHARLEETTMSTAQPIETSNRYARCINASIGKLGKS